jgi:hypothetical protein
MGKQKWNIVASYKIKKKKKKKQVNKRHYSFQIEVNNLFAFFDNRTGKTLSLSV